MTHIINCAQGSIYGHVDTTAEYYQVNISSVVVESTHPSPRRPNPSPSPLPVESKSESLTSESQSQSRVLIPGPYVKSYRNFMYVETCYVSVNIIYISFTSIVWRGQHRGDKSVNIPLKTNQCNIRKAVTYAYT